MERRKVRGRYVVDANGRREAVVLSLEDYERILEDLHDLAAVAERRREGTVNLRKMRGRLRKRTSRPRAAD